MCKIRELALLDAESQGHGCCDEWRMNELREYLNESRVVVSQRKAELDSFTEDSEIPCAPVVSGLLTSLICNFLLEFNTHLTDT